MKTLSLIAIAACIVCSAFTVKTGHTQAKAHVAAGDSVQYFGEKVNPQGALFSTRLAQMLKGKDSLKVKLTGKIESVCQKKGCWMTMDAGDGQTMTIHFKDYAFFAPKNSGGKTAVIEGYAYTETTSVEMLRHYAEDAGKSKAEIEKITKPETAITFMASGLAIMNK
jgi:hypothetical protein